MTQATLKLALDALQTRSMDVTGAWVPRDDLVDAAIEALRKEIAAQVHEIDTLAERVQKPAEIEHVSQPAQVPAIRGVSDAQGLPSVAIPAHTTGESSGHPTITTGWPPGLLQDDCRELARWLSSRPDALYRLRELYAEEAKQMTDERIEALALEHEAFGFGQVDALGLTTHGFDPKGLRDFARAIETEARK